MENMTDEQALEKIRTALNTVLKSKIKEIRPESMLLEDLELESIDVVDFGFELEEAFGRPVDFAAILRGKKHQSGGRYGDVSVADVLSYLLSGS